MVPGFSRMVVQVGHLPSSGQSLTCGAHHQELTVVFFGVHQQGGVCRLHLWSPDGASCVHTPLQNLCTRTVAWRWDGLAAAVCDLERFCVAYTG